MAAAAGEGKLGGRRRRIAARPTEDRLAETDPWLGKLFGDRWPVDKLALSYRVLWNFFRKLAAGYAEPEKDDLFRGTASRVYRLG